MQQRRGGEGDRRDREREIRVGKDEGRELIQPGEPETIGRRFDGWDIM